MTIKQQGGIFGRNPTFNTVTADGKVTAEEVVVARAALPSITLQETDASPSSKIVCDNNGTLNLYAAEGAGAGIFRIYMKGTQAFRIGNNADAIFYRDNGTTAAMTFDASTGNLAFASGNGIDFSATSGTGTSELFDDYEEGTWTATVGCTGNATTTTTVTAYYTKIGRQVTVSFRDLNDIDTTGLSGFLSITLPFTCITASVGFIGALIWDSLTYPAGYDVVFPYTANGASTMLFAIGGSGIADSLLDVSAVTSGTTDLKYATMTYFTA